MLVEISIDLYITVKISFLVTKNKRIAYQECIYACTRNSSRRYTRRIFNLVKHTDAVNRLNLLFVHKEFLGFSNFTSHLLLLL